MPYLVDGHNLIPKIGLRLDSVDDEMELLKILQEFSRLSRRQIEVYFDGAPAGQAGRRKFAAVSAYFVDSRGSADAAIKARLRQLGRASRNWTVVSSDGEVRDAAGRLGANVLSAEEFSRVVAHLQAREEDRRSGLAKSRREGQLDPDVEEWLSLFRDRK